MTNYNDGKWHGWNGMECPVHPESEVEMVWPSGMYPDKANRQTRVAKHFSWKACGDDVPCLFRVIKEHREPKEYTIDPRKNIIWYSSEDDLVHVKELDK